MGKRDAPEPPDPYEVAGAQTGQNVGTAVANQILSHINEITPYGNKTYTQSGTYSWTDPNSGQVYELPQYTVEQTLDPAQQRLHNRQTRAETSLAELAGDQAERLGGLLSRPMNLDDAPRVTAPDLNRLRLDPKTQEGVDYTRAHNGVGYQRTADGVAYQKTADGTFGDAGRITRTYGTDFSDDRQRVEDALMARLNPQLDRDRARLESNMANRGIKLGSSAYDTAFGDFGRQSNDARLGAILGAGEEQARLVGMEAARAGFENSAQQQAYNQALGRGDFMNQARQQNFANQLAAQGFTNDARLQNFQNRVLATGFTNNARDQNLQNRLGVQGFNNAAAQGNFANQVAKTTFNNQAAQQDYGNQSDLRANWLREQYAQRNQPLNEITALLGTGQVQNPMFVNEQGPQMQSTDIAGLINTNYDQRFAGYQAKQQATSDMMGGLFDLGSSFLMGDV